MTKLSQIAYTEKCNKIRAFALGEIEMLMSFAACSPDFVRSEIARILADESEQRLEAYKQT